MEVFYFITDTPHTPLSGMYNLIVRSPSNEIPQLESRVPKAYLESRDAQINCVQELVRDYWNIVHYAIPEADIQFDHLGEIISGKLSGSVKWWTFASESPAFKQVFPYGSIRNNTLFPNSLTPEMIELYDQIEEKLGALEQ